MKTGERITGIILAGGKSSRLGQEKGFVRFRGKTLAEHAIDALKVHCSSLLVSSGDTRYEQFSWPVIPDLEPGRGPMMGLYSCLKVSATKHNLVLAVDNFMVEAGFFGYLLKKGLPAGGIAVPVTGDGFHEPLVGYYNTAVAVDMEAMMAEGIYKLPDLFGRVPFLGLRVENDFPGFHKNYFRSLNTKDDLHFLRSADQL